MPPETLFTLNDIIKVAVAIMGIWGFVEVVKKIIASITERHDKEQSWDEAAIKAKEEREEIVCRYNEQLSDIRNHLEDTRIEFEGKIQEVRAEQFIMIDCLRAVLDGLHQQGCNGRVTKAIETLDLYLNERAHK